MMTDSEHADRTSSKVEEKDKNGNSFLRNLSPREIVALKLQKKREEEEANLKFKPELAHFQFTKNDDHDGVDRFEKLYKDALKRHNSRNELKIQEETSPKPKNSEKRSSSPSVVERLYAAAMETMAHKYGKLENDKSDSFQPTVTKRASSVERNRAYDVNDRLYMQSIEVRERLEKMRKDADAKIAEECPFQPQLNQNSQSLSNTRLQKTNSFNLQDRLVKYEEQRRQKLDELKKAQVEKESQEITFKPKLSTSRSSTPNRGGMSIFERLSQDDRTTVSQQSTEDHQRVRASTPLRRDENGETIFDRLHKEAELRKKEIEKERKLREDAELEGVTFTPQLHTKKESIQGDVPVFERLSTSDKQQMQNILSRIKSDLEMQECTFQPHLHSDESTRPKSSGPPVYERLNAEDSRSREELKRLEEAFHKEEMQMMTFKPSINPKSKEIAKRRSSTPTASAISLGESDLRSSTPTTLRGNASQDRATTKVETKERKLEDKVMTPKAVSVSVNRLSTPKAIPKPIEVENQPSNFPAATSKNGSTSRSSTPRVGALRSSTPKSNGLRSSTPTSTNRTVISSASVVDSKKPAVLKGRKSEMINNNGNESMINDKGPSDPIENISFHEDVNGSGDSTFKPADKSSFAKKKSSDSDGKINHSKVSKAPSTPTAQQRRPSTGASSTKPSTAAIEQAPAAKVIRGRRKSGNVLSIENSSVVDDNSSAISNSGYGTDSESNKNGHNWDDANVINHLSNENGNEGYTLGIDTANDDIDYNADYSKSVGGYDNESELQNSSEIPLVGSMTSISSLGNDSASNAGVSSDASGKKSLRSNRRTIVAHEAQIIISDDMSPDEIQGMQWGLPTDPMNFTM